MLSEYFLVLIYIGGFGLSDLLVKKYKFNYKTQLFYYISIFLIGNFLFFISNN